LDRLLQAKSDATQQLEQKAELEEEKKRMQELAQEKEKLVDRKLKTIGNYVHDSVPINNNEVCTFGSVAKKCVLTKAEGLQRSYTDMGS
jgi:seryl-tRNA synthetase